MPSEFRFLPYWPRYDRFYIFFIQNQKTAFKPPRITFFTSPVNVDFENYLALNLSFNVRWEKAKTVKTMTYMLTSYMTWNLKFDVNIQVILFTVLAFPQRVLNLWLKRRTFSKNLQFRGILFSFITAFWAIDIKEVGNIYRLCNKL